jgi:hypothetical protein
MGFTVKLLALLLCLSFASPALATIALVASDCECSANSGDFVTSNSVNTTNATLITVWFFSYNHSTRPCTMGADSQGGSSNTYTRLADNGTASTDLGSGYIYYSNGANLSHTGASHTWQTNACGTSTYACMCIAAFSGTSSTAFDADDGIRTPDTTATSFTSPTGVTPAGCSEVVFTGESDSVGQGDTITLSNGYTILTPTAQFVASTHIAGAAGYKIKSGSDQAAENPQWGPTMNQGTFVPNATTAMAVFKATSGSCSGGAAGGGAKMQKFQEMDE